ncbi:hypothetical protein ACH49_23475 [Streptomyces leeuwenhoekii]|uniref:Nephrocystin 3-like N-terminal domain-containing protein n=1 Tax=Streptomyces leeuwenhoekii TaxID=1437453 RepID=A0ABR5HTL7_STRLW|nr:serine protease [Streptomyces leeuwenhoekii]KMS72884.1 hypothetical protein ACH49_23475 [Streptomyces leeuwenhoekii]
MKDTDVDKGPPPHRDRVAELIVTHAGGRRRGSGYRITADLVLTAAHVVEHASAVRVRFEPDLPGEWTAAAVSWRADPASDFAVVSIPPRLDEPAVVPVRFGRVGGRTAVVAAQAVGFPRWKMRRDEPRIGADGGAAESFSYRDAHHAVGTVAVLSNFREGTLEFELSSPPATTSDGRASPWEGMSGAALWIGDRIVGVIARHHPDDGLGRLAVARLDLAVAQQPGLRDVLPLPELPGQLPDVLPVPARELSVTAHRAQVADIAPERLYGRERELAELVAFCAGEQPYADQSYLWWQAGPWAGKTALLSWFALHPPAHVDVVSFFVTSRFAGQSDSDAFTDALIEQLAALTSEPPEAPPEPGARQRHLQRLLRAATRQSSAEGRRLLLVVDGLDEDTTRRTAAGRPSIAALLPRRCPPALRVLVAGRPHPPVPDDVPGDHPLRRISPRHLTTSPHAHHLEAAAKHELEQALHGSPVQRDVLGLLTACGGGLTLTDLEQLTGRPRHELEQLLGGRFGRSVSSRLGPDAEADLDRKPAGRQRAYLFAHENLRETAEAEFGAVLADYRDRLHAWAATYRDRGWPPETPPYFLRGYPRLLSAAGDVSRLVGCAADAARHDWMRGRTGGDALALAEIATARDLVARQSVPDLGHLLTLAVARDDLADRGEHVPLILPGLWTRLGRPERAGALAHSITSPMLRSFALQRMIQAGGPHHENPWYIEVVTAAAAAVRAVTFEDSRSEELAQLATVVATVGDHDRALRLSRAAEATVRAVPKTPGSSGHDAVLEELAKAAAIVGDHARAERLARAIEWPDYRAKALVAIAMSVAEAGDLARAVDLARAAKAAVDDSDPTGYVWDVAQILPPVAAAGEGDWYRELADAAEASAYATERAIDRVDALAAVAAAAAAAGDTDRAIRLARDAVADSHAIPRAEDRADTLGELATAMTAMADHDWYPELVSHVEAAAFAVTDPSQRVGRLAKLATAVAATGDDDWYEEVVDEAERAAQLITAGKDRADRLSDLAAAVLAAGDHGRAVELATGAQTAARGVLGSHLRPGVLGSLAPAVAVAGAHDRAEQLARAIPSAGSRAEVLARVATAVAANGDRERAIALARAAEASADGHLHPWPLCAVVKTVTAMGDGDWCRRLVEKAEQIARARPDPLQRPEALATVAAAAATAGDRDRALALIADAEKADLDAAQNLGYFRARAQARIVAAMAAAGAHDRAERLAQGITTHTYYRGHGLAAVAAAVAAAGDHARAQRIARGIDEAHSHVEALGALAAVVAAYSPEHAMSLVREGETVAGAIASAEQRARTLGEMVAKVADAGGSAAVPVRLLTRLINSEGWPTVLPAVGRIDPSALFQLSDMLLTRIRRFPPKFQ